MKCTLYDLGCPNEALEDELFCDYHQKEIAYTDIIHKISSRWTEEDRNNFHKKYSFDKKPMVTSKKIQVVSKDEKKKPKETLKIVLLIKTAVYFFMIFFIITIIVRLVG